MIILIGVYNYTSCIPNLLLYGRKIIHKQKHLSLGWLWPVFRFSAIYMCMPRNTPSVLANISFCPLRIL